jgi:hypothetical protein
MHLVEVFLPLSDNEGREFGPELFAEIRRELTERFGGLTAFSRAPALGLWKQDEGQTSRDDIVILEVMADDLDRAWWSAYRAKLEGRLRQDVVVIRASAVEVI